MPQDGHHGLLIDAAFKVPEALPVSGAVVLEEHQLRRALCSSVTAVVCG
jgi:hypothetical protein